MIRAARKKRKSERVYIYIYKKQGQSSETTDKIIPYNPISECNKPDDCWRTLPSNKPIRMDISTCILNRYRIRNPIECPIASRIRGPSVDASGAYMHLRRIVLFLSR